jgi:predicted dinucleotide-binding enzyme
MHIGIIGAGNIGFTAAMLFLRAGHEIALSNSRDPKSLESQIAQLGTGAQAMTVEGATDYGEVVLVAIPFGKYISLPSAAFQGKVVIDAMNYYWQRDGHYTELDLEQATSSEMLATYLPGARVVKAFNTIYFEHLATQGNIDLPVEERRAIFLAGDDPEAKRIVAKLIEQIGFGPVDTGNLSEGGRQQQPGTPVYNRDLTAAEGRQLVQSFELQ